MIYITKIHTWVMLKKSKHPIGIQMMANKNTRLIRIWRLIKHKLANDRAVFDHGGRTNAQILDAPAQCLVLGEWQVLGGAIDR